MGNIKKCLYDFEDEVWLFSSIITIIIILFSNIVFLNIFGGIFAILIYSIIGIIVSKNSKFMSEKECREWNNLRKEIMGLSDELYELNK